MHNIRLKFLTQIAELLLQGMVGEKYQSPSNLVGKVSHWRPKYYASLNQVSVQLFKLYKIKENITEYIHSNSVTHRICYTCMTGKTNDDITLTSNSRAKVP